MTREEEIFKEAQEFEENNTNINSEVGETSIFDTFIAGAEWADSHSRKGLVDIDKVCNFLDGYSFIPTYVIKELRKVMEK